MKTRNELKIAFQSIKSVFMSVTLFSVFANLLMLTGPLFMLQVYDRVLASSSVETLTALLILITGLFFIFGILDYIRGRVMARAGAKVHTLLSDRIDGISFEADNGKADLLPEQAPSELNALKNTLSSPAPFVFMDMPWAPFFIMAMFVFHPWLGYFGIAAITVMIVIKFINHFSTKDILEEAHVKGYQADHLSQQALQNSEIINALGMRSTMIERMQKARFWATQRSMKAADQNGLFGSSSKSLRFYLQSGILALGAYLAINGNITPGAMIACSILLGRALAPIEQGIAQWPMILRGREAYDNLKRLLESYPQEPRRTSLPAPKAKLKVNNLSLTAPNSDKITLAGITFDVQPGEVLGVLGKSACGKSSLAKAIANIWKPRGGTIKLDGADLFQWPSEEFGQMIGYLPQDISLMSGTVAENIARMKEGAPSAKIIKAAKSADAHDMILSLPDGYETVVGENGMALSGGQRQRIGLARALFGDPVMVVLDEPNSHLDQEGEHALVTAIKTLKDKNRCVILAAHRPNVVSICDKILILENGRMKAFGTHDELMGNANKPRQIAPRSGKAIHKLARLKA